MNYVTYLHYYITGVNALRLKFKPYVLSDNPLILLRLSGIVMIKHRKEIF